MLNQPIAIPVITVGCYSPATLGLYPDTALTWFRRYRDIAKPVLQPSWLSHEHQWMLESSPVWHTPGPNPHPWQGILHSCPAQIAVSFQLLHSSVATTITTTSWGVLLAPQPVLFPAIICACASGCSDPFWHSPLTCVDSCLWMLQPSSIWTAPSPNSLGAAS